MKNKIHGYWFLLLASNIFCHTLFAQSQYYQATVYFIYGVQRNLTATYTSATVTASDIQTILTRYAISGNSIYPSFPEFRESDTLKVFVTDGGYVDSLKPV